jgi:hypothetical protein
MRGAWIVAAALAVGALLPPTARAGVYFTTGTHVRAFAKADDPDAQELWPLPSAFSQFRQDLADYRAAAVVGPNHERYLRRVKELEEKESQGTLSLDDRINLGAYYIRLQQPQKAIRVLEAKARESRHFLLRANLATAYEMAGGLDDRARDYRQLALASWPATYAAWDGAQLNFYRKAEQYHLTLLQLRQQSARARTGRSRLQLDNLFPRVQFVGPGGEYEAGTIAPAQWADIPADAIDVVMQLLLWMPFDDPLHWQLGELLNARGDVSGAAAMMKEVLNKSQDPAKWDAAAPPELREHYRVVAAAAAAREKYYAPEVVSARDPFILLKLRAALAPRGTGLGAGDLLQEATWPVLVIATEELAQRQARDTKRTPDANTKAAAKDATSSASAPPSWQPNWRQLGVGFGAGALVALLLVMQLRQAGRPKG